MSRWIISDMPTWEKTSHLSLPIRSIQFYKSKDGTGHALKKLPCRPLLKRRPVDWKNSWPSPLIIVWRSLEVFLSHLPAAFPNFLVVVHHVGVPSWQHLQPLPLPPPAAAIRTLNTRFDPNYVRQVLWTGAKATFYQKGKTTKSKSAISSL